MHEQLTAAIQQRRVVTFTYQGHERRVQPAALGVGGRKHRATLHAYQVSGGSQRGGIPHWRNFHADAITGLAVTDETFTTPPGYARPWMSEVTVALDSAEASGPAGSAAASSGDSPLAGLPINAETAAKAAEAAGKAFGALGKWLKKR